VLTSDSLRKQGSTIWPFLSTLFPTVFLGLRPAAIAFAGAFYRALADRWPVDAAVVEGRKFVQGEVGLDAPWWALPVLYMRAEDGKLFV